MAGVALAAITPVTVPPLGSTDLGDGTKRVTSPEGGYTVVVPSAWRVTASAAGGSEPQFGQAHLSSYDPRTAPTGRPEAGGMMPPEGYQGVDRVLGTVDGLKKFISIKESPYHGLNFCQGTVSEMLADPGKEIFDVIRYFGTRQKIFNVHFRNIRGHRNDFLEVYPDEGDINFVKVIQLYKEIGYPYMLMPDHVPVAPNDPGGLQSFAFCYGYIRALIQAVDQMA